MYKLLLTIVSIIGIALIIIIIAIILDMIFSPISYRIKKRKEEAARKKELEDERIKQNELHNNPDYIHYKSLIEELKSESKYIHMQMREVTLQNFQSHTRDKIYALKTYANKNDTDLNDLVECAKRIETKYNIEQPEDIDDEYVHKNINSLIEGVDFYKTVSLKVMYYSPAGRSSQVKDFTYSIEEIENLVIQEQKKIDTNQSERAKLTPKLRYKILARDNYTCQYCGAQAKDGVKLHIDHIKPISKGGLTTEDNLITACETCNLGKGDN